MATAVLEEDIGFEPLPSASDDLGFEPTQSAPATPLQKLAPMTAAVVSPGIGELRRREGAGEIAAGPATWQQEALRGLPGYTAEDVAGAVRNPEPGMAVQEMKTAAPIAAGIAAGGAVPMAGAGGLVSLAGRLGLSGAASGVAEQATREALGDGGNGNPISNIAKSGAFGATAGVLMAPAARYAPQILSAGRELLKSGKDRAARMFAAVRQPYSPSLGQIESAAARNLIAERTGVQVPITGTSEVLGNPKVADELKNSVAGSEMSTEAIDAIKREVATVASQVKNSGMTVEDLSNGTLEVLRGKLGEISKPSEDAVKALSAQLYPAIQQSFDEIQGAAKALIPGTAATPGQLGKSVRDATRAAYAGFKATDRANYGAAKALPEAAEVRVKPSAYNEVVDEFQANAPQTAVKTEQEFFETVDEFGRPIPKPPGAETKPIKSMLPEGTGKFAAPRLAPEQTLEQARQLRTLLGDSFNDDTILPGLGNATKRKLYGALTQDINNAIDALPSGNLKTALDKANAYHRENVDRFIGNDIEKILHEFGTEGGAGPAGIMAKFQGDDAPAFLSRLETSAGKEGAPKVAQAAKEFLFNEIGQAARNPVTGEVSVAKMVEGVNKLAPEIQKRFFNRMATVKALAQKEGALSKLKAGSGDIIKNLEVDPALLDEALTTGSPEVMKRLGDAVKKSVELDKQLRGSVLGALSKGSAAEVTDAISQNPIKFVRSITDGSFTPAQTAKTLDMVGRENPALLQQLQFNYVDDLIGSHVTKNGISASEIVKSLGAGSSTAGPGSLRANTVAVLGQGKTDGLAEVMGALAKLESNQSKLTASTPLVDVMVKGVGGLLGEVAASSARIGPIGAANQASWLASKYRNGRYRAVAHLLTTPELRKLALTPIGQVTKDNINNLIRGTVSAVSSVEGDNSPAMDDLEAMALEASR